MYKMANTFHKLLVHTEINTILLPICCRNLKLPWQSRHSSTGGDTKEVVIVMTQKTGRQNTYTHTMYMCNEPHPPEKKDRPRCTCHRVITWHICCSALNFERETSHIFTRTGHLEPQKSPFKIPYTICQSTRDLTNQRWITMKHQFFWCTCTSQFYIQVTVNLEIHAVFCIYSCYVYSWY